MTKTFVGKHYDASHRPRSARGRGEGSESHGSLLVARPDPCALCLAAAGADFAELPRTPQSFHGHKRHCSVMYGQFAKF